MIRQQEPLTPEERELAAQLSRLGPHGEPSPALDSRIMAAAHAELAATKSRRQKPRWPVALSLAASVLLAVGVAWQLRPLQETPTASEVPTAAAAPESPPLAAVETQAADVAEQIADATPPPPAPEAFPVTPDTNSGAAPASPPQLEKPAAPGTAARAPAPVKYLARVPTPKSTTPETARYSPPPPPPPPAPAEDARAGALAEPAPIMQASHDAERTAVQAEQAAQAKRARDEATSNRLLLRESEQRRRQESPMAAASAIAQDTIAEEASSARATLRRTDLQLPVAEDAKLAPAEWLNRIRLRRDLGDSGNASASLRLFVDAHPFQRVPEDLRPLLGEE